MPRVRSDRCALTARPATLTLRHVTRTVQSRKTHDTASESRRVERSRARMREVASTVSCGLDDAMLHTRPTLLSHPNWYRLTRRPPTQIACKFAPELELRSCRAVRWDGRGCAQTRCDLRVRRAPRARRRRAGRARSTPRPLARGKRTLSRSARRRPSGGR